jgi:Protein kinase domain
LKICDFGIASAADATSQLTATGQSIGTPAYMSPEQCEGKQVDGRSDLYSLGCVLYGLLTGRPPFQASEPFVVMRQHLDTVAPDLRSLRPQVPEQLDRLVLRLLAKNPADRPSNAGYVAAALTAIQYPQTGVLKQGAPAHPVAARPPTAIARTVTAARYQPGAADGATEPSLAADIDPARAERLLNDAERIARAIKDDERRFFALAGTARAYATIDPAHAERIAGGIKDKIQRAFALAGIARAYAADDPARARQLIADAEQLAREIPPNEFNRVYQLRLVAGVCVDIAPARAARLAGDIEEMARAIGRRDYRDVALKTVVEMYAIIDPVRAEQIVGVIQDEAIRAEALGASAKAYATVDPERAEQLITDAEQLAREIHDDRDRAVALGSIVRAWAGTDPGRAERIAHAIPNESWRAGALTAIANACAQTDPAHAGRLINDAEQLDRRIHDGKQELPGCLARIAKTCASFDRVHAERVLNDAEQLARAIPDVSSQAAVLADIADACTAIDPDRAEKIAYAIRDDDRRAWALVRIANAVLRTTDLQVSM